MDMVPIERAELLRELGALLRQYREQQNVKGKDLAECLKVAPARITRIEQGLWMPDSETLRGIARSLNLGEEVVEHLLDMSAAYLLQREAHADVHHERLLSLESRAEKIQVVARTLVPPILQTEKYAREVLRNKLGIVSPSLLEEAVAAQRERAAQVAARLRFLSIILFEDALIPTIGSEDIMDEQLTSLSNCPYDLLVVPIDAPRITSEDDYRIVDDRVVLFSGPRDTTFIAFGREIVLQYASHRDQLEGLSLRSASRTSLLTKHFRYSQQAIEKFSISSKRNL